MGITISRPLLRAPDDRSSAKDAAPTSAAQVDQLEPLSDDRGQPSARGAGGPRPAQGVPGPPQATGAASPALPPAEGRGPPPFFTHVELKLAYLLVASRGESGGDGSGGGELLLPANMRDAGGKLLPYLPLHLRDSIVERVWPTSHIHADIHLDSIIKVWLERLSLVGREALFSRAAKMYGIESKPNGCSWAAHLDQLGKAAPRALEPSMTKLARMAIYGGRHLDVARDWATAHPLLSPHPDAVLVGLAAGDVLPAEAVLRHPSHVAIVRAAVHRDGEALALASQQMQARQDVVTRAVRTRGTSLRYASPQMQAQREVVMEAVKQDGYALRYASSPLRKDVQVVMAAVASYPEGALAFAHADVQENPAVVGRAVRVTGRALEDAAPSMRDREDIVAVAIESYPLALEWASERLRHRRDLVMLAVRGDSRALNCVDDSFRDDPDILRVAIAKDPTMTADRARELVTWDSSLYRNMLEKACSALRLASPRLQDDPLLVKDAVEQNARAFQFASERLRADPALALFAVRGDESNLVHVGRELRESEDFRRAVAEQRREPGEFADHLKQY